MSTLQVNTIETNTPGGVLAIRDVDNALTAIQPGAVQGTAAGTAPVFRDSAGTEIGTLCRAWVNFNGGSITIRAAFNVSSITDNGVGLYTLNFTNPMPDGNYAVVGTGGNQGGNNVGSIGPTGTNTTTAVGVTMAYTNTTTYDANMIWIAVFR